jgi:hypothetical protein
MGKCDMVDESIGFIDFTAMKYEPSDFKATMERIVNENCEGIRQCGRDPGKSVANKIITVLQQGEIEKKYMAEMLQTFRLPREF